MTLTIQEILDWLGLVASVLEENRGYLTELDAAIGDADHGINMDRGFKRVAGQLPEMGNKDIGTIFKTVGMTLISSVGGASGPLYGTFFLRAGQTTTGKSELSRGEIADMFKAALSGVKERGRAQPGDKTMIDVWGPATEALAGGVEQGKGLIEAIELATIAAEQGMKSTIPLQARKGRASYLGPRSIGYQDPGATSSYLILKALFEILNRKA